MYNYPIDATQRQELLGLSQPSCNWLLKYRRIVSSRSQCTYVAGFLVSISVVHILSLASKITTTHVPITKQEILEGSSPTL